MFRKICLLALCLASFNLVHSATTHVFDVLKYGAIADGKHVNTGAIAAAIKAASAAGGGTVHFPKASHPYLTGPIHLKSNITLQLDDGVVIKFSDNFEDYLPMVPIRKSGLDIHNFSPLIYGYKVSHIAIKGKGTLDGSGKKWWDFFNHLRDEHKKTGHWNTNSKWQEKFFAENAELVKHHKFLKEPGFFRPPLFHPIYSDHITLEGVTFKDSPWFTVAPFVCNDIKIDHVKVINPSNAPNTDGIHPDSCRHVTISNCFVDTGDDGIVFTADQDKNGNHKRPTENVTVTDCEVHSAHGGIVIGSAVKGGVRDIHARNLHFQNTLRGIRIKSSRGNGGVVENIFLSDITMHNISHEGITINAFYTNAPEEPYSPERTPVYHDIHIQKVTGDSKLGIQILGLPEKHFERIELKDVKMVAKEKEVISNANVVQHNVTYTIDKHLYDKHHN